MESLKVGKQIVEGTHWGFGAENRKGSISFDFASCGSEAVMICDQVKWHSRYRG